jgi:hypothetical protein
MKEMLYRKSDEMAELTRPYKIVISLMDRADIGGLLVEHLFLDFMSSLRQHVGSREGFIEVSFNYFLLFANVFTLLKMIL